MILQLIFLGATFIFLTIFVYLVQNYRKNYTFWTNSTLPYIPFPFDCVFHPSHKSVTLQKFYNELAPHPMGGIYKMSRPFLLIRDPELVRNVLIRDFSHFMDHGIEFDEKLDPLNPHLFNLEGDRWRILRHKLNPVFSRGKIKGMWPLMMQCTTKFLNYLDHQIEKDDQFEVKDAVSKFAMDVIGTCAFGLECDAIQDDESEYRRMTKSIFRESYVFFFKSLLRSMHPRLTFWLRWKRIHKSVDDFFFFIVKESARLRSQNENKRQDIMQHLINLQHEEQESLKQQNSNAEPLMTDSIVAAQAFKLYVAGFETTAGTMAYVLYELALQPKLMAKCREEVKSVLEQGGGTLTYDSLKNMTYLQCCIDEALRLHPLAGWLDRICVKSYELPDKSYTIKENMRLLIPVYALHMDPKYFPEPHRFNPDRFKEENKHNIVPGTYIPFGDGPRICIGIRFAQTEMKTALASLIMKYDVEPTEKTDIPLRIAPTILVTASPTGVWLRFKKRAEV